MQKKTKADEANRDALGGSGLTKRILITSLPIAGQSLISFASSFIDSLMVAPLGGSAVGGVYAGSEIQRLLRYFLIGVESAVLISGSAAIGKSKRREARMIGIWGIAIATATALAVTLLSLLLPHKILGLFSSDGEIIESGALYLRISALSFPVFCLSETVVTADRCLGGKGAGPVSSGVSLAVAIVLDLALIGGRLGAPALGVRGAAISAIVSRGAGLLSLLIFFLIRRLIRRRGAPAALIHEAGEIGNTPHRFSALRELLRAAMPTVSAQMLWGVYMMLSAAIMTGLTESGAAAGIAAAAYNLAMAPVSGYTAALSMLAGRASGKGDGAELYRLRRTSERLSLIIGGITALLTAILSRPSISLYSPTAQTATAAVGLITILVLTLPLSAYESPALYGILRGSGEAPFVLKTDLIVLFGLILPAAYLAKDIGAPAATVYFILRSEAAVKAAVSAVRLRISLPKKNKN